MINVQDFKKRSNGWTALHYATDSGHTDVMKYLLANSADKVCLLNPKSKIMREYRVWFNFSSINGHLLDIIDTSDGRRKFK